MLRKGQEIENIENVLLAVFLCIMDVLQKFTYQLLS